MQLELGKVENAEWHINKAFSRAKKRINLVKIKGKLDKVGKYKYLEAIRISIVKDVLYSDLERIIKAFPKYTELDEFYRELFACFIDVDSYKKALGSLKWAQTQISKIYRISNSAVVKQKSVNEVLSARNMFLARASSVFKQISESFTILDLARSRIKELPNIKTSLPTVAIAGFPNVGKSTLLGKLTDSTPEIKSYAFTTKALMIGFILDEKIKVQIIDTPGTLNRFDKMNKIEKMSNLCMRYAAHSIVYVFDLSETSYPIEDQVKLFNDISEFNKEIIVYFSKSDILDKKIIENFDIKGITDSEKLKQQLVYLSSQLEL
jgi:nucleolar GTP-binding protein